jgi:hypothetical protein
MVAFDSQEKGGNLRGIEESDIVSSYIDSGRKDCEKVAIRSAGKQYLLLPMIFTGSEPGLVAGCLNIVMNLPVAYKEGDFLSRRASIGYSRKISSWR